MSKVQAKAFGLPNYQAKVITAQPNCLLKASTAKLRLETKVAQKKTLILAHFNIIIFNYSGFFVYFVWPATLLRQLRGCSSVGYACQDSEWSPIIQSL